MISNICYLCLSPVSDNTRYDEKVGSDVEQHYRGPDKCYFIGFPVIGAGFFAQGFGPDAPDLIHIFLDRRDPRSASTR